MDRDWTLTIGGEPVLSVETVVSAHQTPGVKVVLWEYADAPEAQFGLAAGPDLDRFIEILMEARSSLQSSEIEPTGEEGK